MAEAKKSAQLLDAALIVQTIERLHARIEAREHFGKVILVP